MSAAQQVGFLESRGLSLLASRRPWHRTLAARIDGVRFSVILTVTLPAVDFCEAFRYLLVRMSYLFIEQSWKKIGCETHLPVALRCKAVYWWGNYSFRGNYV
jgi:hypothetical protein